MVEPVKPRKFLSRRKRDAGTAMKRDGTMEPDKRTGKKRREADMTPRQQMYLKKSFELIEPLRQKIEDSLNLAHVTGHMEGYDKAIDDLKRKLLR